MIAASALRETDRRNIVTHFWNQLSDLQNLRPGVISNVRIFRLLSRHSLLFKDGNKFTANDMVFLSLNPSTWKQAVQAD